MEVHVVGALAQTMLVMLWQGEQGRGSAGGVCHPPIQQSPLWLPLAFNLGVSCRALTALQGTLTHGYLLEPGWETPGWRDSPSMAYFMSWANRFHITSALILPTFSSWGNLAKVMAV